MSKGNWLTKRRAEIARSAKTPASRTRLAYVSAEEWHKPPAATARLRHVWDEDGKMCRSVAMTLHLKQGSPYHRGWEWVERGAHCWGRRGYVTPEEAVAAMLDEIAAGRMSGVVRRLALARRKK